MAESSLYDVKVSLATKLPMHTKDPMTGDGLGLPPTGSLVMSWYF